MDTHPSITEFIGVAPSSEFNFAEIVETGLPLDTLALLRTSGLTAGEIGEIVVSPRTVKHRRSRGESLSHEETDRLVRVARIVALAHTVFGIADKSLLWLRSVDDRIAGRNPLSLLRTESGGRLVESMLWQIDEGLYT